MALEVAVRAAVLPTHGGPFFIVARGAAGFIEGPSKSGLLDRNAIGLSQLHISELGSGVHWFIRAGGQPQYQPSMDVRIGGLPMVALARALSRASGVDVDVESLKAVIALAGVGLLVSLMFIIYGLDILP
jgi:hypothetical protein